MKKILAVALLLCIVAVASAAPKNPIKCKYVDANELTIINKVHKDGARYARLDVDNYNFSKNLKYVFGQSTGLAVVFRTNSRTIRARWTTSANTFISSTTGVLQRGLDLYIRKDGEWVFAGEARPDVFSDSHEFAIAKRMAEGEKECMLYLPMFAHLNSLEIGIDKSATIEAMPSPYRHRVTFVGSSLTHGAAASRPGASYVAMLGRNLGVETPNFGHSGQCKMQQYFVDIVCNTTADAFVFDVFSNPTGDIIRERLYDFVRKIRAKHPDTPLIFLQTIKREDGVFDLGMCKRSEAQRAAAEECMKKVCKEFNDVYFINPAFILGNEMNGTVDGSHLNALSTYRTVKYLTPKLKRILKKYGIK